MILIGSRALEHYASMTRKLHDWDLVVTYKEYLNIHRNFAEYLVKQTDTSSIFEKNNEIIEVKRYQEDSDYFITVHNTHTIDTPFGLASVPSLQCLYDIKKATALYIDEPKHKADLQLMEKLGHIFIGSTWFFRKRVEETRLRTEESNKIKHDFFHKYHIPEYILHDRLHDLYADLLGITLPTYKRITVAETDIAEDLFDNLTHDQKISLMVEEVLVLNLERWFIPQMVENGINHRLVDYFYNNNEAMPTYLILKHVCQTGLKGEADYITSFGRANFFEIENEWIKAKEVIKAKGGFPDWFFQELFDLRKRHRNGETVAIV